MSFKPTWDEWWKYYTDFGAEHREQVAPTLIRTIKDAHGSVRDEMLKCAPPEIQAKALASKKPKPKVQEPVRLPSPEELKAQQENALRNFYGDKPRPESVAELRKNGNRYGNDRYTLYRIAHSLARGIFGGRGG